jgi:hypothetical protein
MPDTGDVRESELCRLLNALIDEAMGTTGAFETAVLAHAARVQHRDVDQVLEQARLPPREREAIEYLMAGWQPWEIARWMTTWRIRRSGSWLAVRTVDNHLATARRKLLYALAPAAVSVQS